MDSQDQTLEDLIADISSFLKRERELFGDFSTGQSHPVPESPEVQNNEKEEIEDPSERYRIEVRHPVAASNRDTTHRRQQKNHSAKVPTIQEQLESCTTLEELRELCQRTDLLRTDLEDTNLVFGVGNPDADLVLVGEAPGEEEDRQGEPFVGRAGQLLNDILAAIDFSRDDVYIANILKHRPPNNRDPNPEERERSLPFLLKQLELINPKLILSLGKVSAQTLLNSDQSLGRMRGKFHPFMDKYELLATYHPAALLRHEKWKRPTWEDVQKLRKRYDELNCSP